MSNLVGPPIRRYHLHPPILKAFGLKQKIQFGRWFDWAYLVLRGLKALRGTPFDLFGYDRVRKTERDLIVQYRGLIFAALDELSAETYSDALKLAKLPDLIRGYDAVKLGNVERFWREVQALGFQDFRDDSPN